MAKKTKPSKSSKSTSAVGDEYKAPTSPKEPATPPPPAGGPGSPMEIIFSFDTTGSMYSLLGEVRKNVSDLITRLQNDIPNIKIGVIAHGDYCDEKTSYVVKMIDLTRDTDKLVNFVQNVGQTGGGDGDECYELALKTARTQFSWSHGTLRSLVVIGDADPHNTNYYFYKDHTPIDWKQETQKLFAMGVHIYGVKCGSSSSADNFYQQLAKKTDGTYLELKDFKNIFDMICAICYKEHGAEYFYAYEKEVREREKRIAADLDSMLVTLRKSASNASTMSIKTSDPPTPRTTSLKRVAPTAVVAPTPAKKVRIAPGVAAKKKPALKKKTAAVTKKILPKKKTVKTLKPKSTTKVVRKSPKKTGKPSTEKASLPKRTPREMKAAGTNIKNCSWSKWEIMFSPKPEDKAIEPRRNGHVGYCNPRVFADDRSDPSVYEVAVSTSDSGQKYVVFVRGSIHARTYLDTFLFRYSKGLQQQIDDLLRKKCRIYVRRCELSSSGTRVQTMTRTRMGVRYLKSQYDYAWCKRGFGRRRFRAVTKNGVVISDGKY